MSFSLGINYVYCVTFTPCLVFNRYIHSFTRYTKAAFVPLTTYLFIPLSGEGHNAYLSTVFLLSRRFFCRILQLCASETGNC